MEPSPEPARAVSAARAHLDRGFRFEKGGALDRALDAYRAAVASAGTPQELAEAHICIARVHRTTAKWTEAREESTLAAQIAEDAGADDLAAEALNIEIGCLQLQGFFEQADTLGERAIRLARSPRVRGITLQNLGRGAAERRDFETSDRYFAESVTAFREAKYDIGLAVAFANAARAALDRGDVQRSVEIGEDAIAIARRANLLDMLLTAVQNQAAALVTLGELDQAESLLTEALGHFTSVRNPVRQAECLEIMGQISELRADWETAVRCYLRARDLATAANDQPLMQRLVRRIQSAMDARSGIE